MYTNKKVCIGDFYKKVEVVTVWLNQILTKIGLNFLNIYDKILKVLIVKLFVSSDNCKVKRVTYHESV